MSEQQHVQRSRTTREEHQVIETTVADRDAGLDELLDEIDSVLEQDASEYVRSFLQKGGQ